ncbi:hypothetical protein PTSG_10250 [Salpingoeca rosetta]|uniref:Uncharacterized protein n=1 Tax=Salpingoeca rosetta (strain ATCC 50818 / BSB-021) TaxID=946362 RepID=F2UQR3_SALR5|nr:uncharacterized protein PTSG_10250 [Salpingoeca rosetta]EGD79968.1 hypothetical protein PTSG_10250 [Salpingoeca rosetta]|eukprot:XP_004988589.1 hypothetical protein PTSG_10250 [Salpingoeca rosetta]
MMATTSATIATAAAIVTGTTRGPALSGMREMWSPWHQHQQEEDTRGHNDDTALLLLEDVVPGLMQPATEHPLDMMTMMMTTQHQQQPYVEAVHGPWCTDSVDGGYEADEEDEDVSDDSDDDEEEEEQQQQQGTKEQE